MMKLGRFSLRHSIFNIRYSIFYVYRETQIVVDNNNVAPDDGQLVINVGPQHPATHGVLHLVITLQGETIQKVEPHLGYIHRSIEKMCESLSYRQFIYVTSRMDYLSAHMNNHGCALCVEKGLQLEVPARAQRRRFGPVHLARGRACVSAPQVRRDPQGAHRLPRDARRAQPR